MRSERSAVLLLGALTAAAVVLALALVGGPSRAALERRDDRRFSDIQSIRWTLECIRERQGAFPATLEPEPACGEMQLSDPVTGAPYSYERLSDDSFRICAAFEDPERVSSRAEPMLEVGADGCITAGAAR